MPAYGANFGSYRATYNVKGGFRAKLVKSVEAVDPACGGLASLQVFFERQGPPIGAGVTVTGRPILFLSWETEAGVGEARCDATNGANVAIPGATGLSVEFDVWDIDADGIPPANPDPADYKLGAVLTWGTSISPKPVRYTAPRLMIADGGTPSTFQKIPPFADTIQLVADKYEFLPNSSIEFYSSASTHCLMYSSPASGVRGTPIVAGASYFVVRNNNPSNQLNCIPIFTLKL